jgi:hypothetical protein
VCKSSKTPHWAFHISHGFQRDSSKFETRMNWSIENTSHNFEVNFEHLCRVEPKIDAFPERIIRICC